MTTAVTTPEPLYDLLERVVIGGDLSKLTPAERLRYYRHVCTSVGLNPLTKPFEYLHLNGKLILYARRDATDQLRKLHGVSIQITAREQYGDVYVVVARATDKEGRADEAIGAVSTAGLKGDMLANALMKAETKAKRRVTLSICGLGMLDETEVETIPNARRVPIEEMAEELDPAKVETAEITRTPDRDVMDIAEFSEWLAAMQHVRTLKSAQDLWTQIQAKDVWSRFTPTEQVELTAAKNAAKQRIQKAEVA